MNEKIKRYFWCIMGLFVAALGVAITKRGELGVSPISSVANVLSLRYDFLSLGNWLIIWNCILILGQILILRKKFNWLQLMQLPLSFLFGCFTDLGMFLVSFIPVRNYPVQLLMVLLGTLVLGLGVSLSVKANVIMNSGEAFVKAIADTTGKVFGNVKIAFDISCVLLAVALSLVFFQFTLVGTREGTIIAAIFTGTIVKFFSRHIHLFPAEKPST